VAGQHLEAENWVRAWTRRYGNGVSEINNEYRCQQQGKQQTTVAATTQQQQQQLDS